MSTMHLENILNEVRILGSAKHPNVLKLKRKYKSEESYNMILEYCNGGDLSSFRKKLCCSQTSGSGIRMRESIVQEIAR